MTTLAKEKQTSETGFTYCRDFTENVFKAKNLLGLQFGGLYKLLLSFRIKQNIFHIEVLQLFKGKKKKKIYSPLFSKLQTSIRSYINKIK